MKKILSIVIPSYNVEQYLRDTLDTLVLCAFMEYLDIIIVDDGSKDRTGQIADYYAEKYSSSISVIHKENGGHGSTINCGLKKAVGTYFVVIDGDDWVDPKTLDEFLMFLHRTNSDVIVTGHYKNYIVDGREERYSYEEQRGFTCHMSYLLEKNYLIPMTDTCYKTELLRRVNLTIQENTFYVDEEFCSFPYQLVQEICFFGDGFYHYRIGDVNQSISVENSLKRISHKERVIHRIYRALSEKMYPDNKEYISRKLAGMLNSVLMLNYLYQPDKKFGREKGREFYKKICNEYSLILPKCKKVNTIFFVMNVLHLGERQWSMYQRMKYRLYKRRKHSA